MAAVHIRHRSGVTTVNLDGCAANVESTRVAVQIGHGRCVIHCGDIDLNSTQRHIGTAISGRQIQTGGIISR